MAEKLLGLPVAEALYEKTRTRVKEAIEKGVTPLLAILRVGEKEANLVYEGGIMRRSKSVGVIVKKHVLPESVSQEELMAAVHELNEDKSVHGVLVFSPLPEHLDMEQVRNALAPQKDVDGITGVSMATVYSGAGIGYAPCTAQACMELLDYYGISCEGRRAAVVGRSLVAGRPVSMLLMGRNATVTTCHTRTVDTPSVTRETEILVVAAGRAGSVGAEHAAPGQVVIDVGININEAGELCGDVDLAGVEPIVGAIAPVPGGVGSVTTAVLVSHVVEAAIKTLI